ncbi:hypothetical protein [Streptomyces sp. NBC_01500]|uniref:hypothetical protein n=1 Tax=Streptomyces sp. NBC_01500 TaxID=2903886 RepID=UPI0022580029|nr:hypothetical protein [Streptomyces sp. NBC_01500]MCX4554145.1 hypothetical protein [Streptomyces sp. NBC_01500]
MNDFLRDHVVRVLAVVAALAPVVAVLTTHLPWEVSAGVTAAILAAGEYAQRIENSKTLQALLTEAPEHTN